MSIAFLNPSKISGFQRAANSLTCSHPDDDNGNNPLNQAYIYKESVYLVRCCCQKSVKHLLVPYRFKKSNVCNSAARSGEFARFDTGSTKAIRCVCFYAPFRHFV